MRVVIDLDGTICTQEMPGEYHLAKPVNQVIMTLQALKDKHGAYIIIYTARGMKTFRGSLNKIIERYDLETRRWLEENKVPFDELVFGKPSGDVYIDDKALNVKEWL